MDFKRYQRKGVIEARPWTDEEAAAAMHFHRPVYIHFSDLFTACKIPAVGFVLRELGDLPDGNYCPPDYFAKHYEEEK